MRKPTKLPQALDKSSEIAERVTAIDERVKSIFGLGASPISLLQTAALSGIGVALGWAGRQAASMTDWLIPYGPYGWLLAGIVGSGLFILCVLAPLAWVLVKFRAWWSAANGTATPRAAAEREAHNGQSLANRLQALEGREQALATALEEVRQRSAKFASEIESRVDGVDGHIKNIPAMLSLIEGLSNTTTSTSGIIDGLNGDVRKISASASEAGEKLEVVEREIVRTNPKIYALQRSSLVLADFAEHALRLDIIRNLLRSPPDLENAFAKAGVTDGWLAEQTDIAEGYVGIVEDGLGDARLTYEIQNALRQAEFRADAVLAATPIEERPVGIDPYRLRLYMIAKAKRDGAVTYLENEQLKMAKKQGYYLQRIMDEARVETPLTGAS